MLLIVPYGTTRPLRRPPYATYALIGLNTAVYLVSLAVLVGAGLKGVRSFLEWGGLTPEDLRWHSLLTNAFFHDSPLPMHLAGNMLFLFIFGRNVEDALGPVLFLVAYLSGHAAAMLSHVGFAYALSPADLEVPVLGASGAIAAVLGVFLIRFYRTRIKVFWLASLFGLLGRAGTVLVTSLWALPAWFLWDLVQGLLNLGHAGEATAGGVANWAHVGGFAFGCLLGLALGLREEAVDMYAESDAYAFFREGEWRRAAACFEQLVLEEPENVDAHFKLALAYDLTHRGRRAVPEYVEAIRLAEAAGDASLAAATCLQLFRYHPATHRLPAPSYLRAASELERHGEYVQAAYVLESLVRAHGRLPEAEQAAVRAGHLFLEHLADPRRAYQIFEALLRQRPNSPYADAAREGARAARARLGPRGLA